MANATSPYEVMLKQLSADRDRLLIELAKVDAAIAGVQDLIGAQISRQVAMENQFKNVPVVEPPANKLASLPKQVSSSSDYYGLSLPEAVHKALKVTGKEMLPREINEILQHEGVNTESVEPAKRIQDALRRREKSHKDVMRTGWGKWGIPDWYDELELKKIEAILGGQPGRDRQTHIEKTKRGIRKAQARGARYGAPPKVSPEQWKLAIKLVRGGESNMSEIHRKLVELTPEGEKPLSKASVVNYSKLFKKFEPYPERWQKYYDSLPKRNQGNPTVNIRVVK